jgi:hypothetical protein
MSEFKGRVGLVASLITAILLLLCISPSAFAANCSQTDITIESQSDVDNFQSLYGGGGTCDTVVGSLLINNVFDSSAWTSLTNLDGLSGLHTIGGDLEISNNDAGSASNTSNSLTDIRGLSQLESIGGHFALLNNSQLSDCKWIAELLGWPDGENWDKVGGYSIVGSNAVGCNSIQEVYEDATASWGDEPLPNQPDFSGLFYDPNNSGHGFDFNVLNEGLIVYYYGHTSDGARLWLISELVTESITFGTPLVLHMFEIDSGTFGQPGSPATFWGSITIVMNDHHSGQATFSGEDGALQMDIVRLACMFGYYCPPQIGPGVLRPTVSTDAATAIDQNGAVFNATIDANGGETKARFEYGESSSNEWLLPWHNVAPEESNFHMEFYVNVFECGTTIHFRAVAENSEGTSYGEDRSFTTVSCEGAPPTVSTSAATEIGQNKATLNSYVHPNGLETRHWIEYGTSISYGTASAKIPITGNSRNSIGLYLTTLRCNTNYHFRSVAENALGISYGNDLSFKTLACP